NIAGKHQLCGCVSSGASDGWRGKYGKEYVVSCPRQSAFRAVGPWCGKRRASRWPCTGSSGESARAEQQCRPRSADDFRGRRDQTTDSRGLEDRKERSFIAMEQPLG